MLRWNIYKTSVYLQYSIIQVTVLLLIASFSYLYRVVRLTCSEMEIIKKFGNQKWIRTPITFAIEIPFGILTICCV